MRVGGREDEGERDTHDQGWGRNLCKVGLKCRSKRECVPVRQCVSRVSVCVCVCVETVWHGRTSRGVCVMSLRPAHRPAGHRGSRDHRCWRVAEASGAFQKQRTVHWAAPEVI